MVVDPRDRLALQNRGYDAADSVTGHVDKNPNADGTEALSDEDTKVQQDNGHLSQVDRELVDDLINPKHLK